MKKVIKSIWTEKEMTDVRKRVDHYRYKMFLNEWFFKLLFDNGYGDDDGKEDKSIAAETDVLSEYKKATITFYAPSREELRKSNKVGSEGIDMTIKHELAHSVTDKMTKLAEERFVNQREIDKECESLTQYISNCVESDYKNVQRSKSSRVNKVNKVLAKRKK